MNSRDESLDKTYIPVGIVREILLRLPAVSLLRLRAVCKGWCSVIDDPSFIRAHTKNQQQVSSTFIFRNKTGPPFAALYYVDADELDDFSNGLQTIPVTPLKLTRAGLSRHKALPVAACNGLLLFAPLHVKNKKHHAINWDPDGVWELRNPLTQERLELPRNDCNYQDLLGVGLGYDCVSDDYKVVAVEVKRCTETASRTHVYSLRWDSWRAIANYPTGGGFWPFWGSQDVQNGVFLNGALHWLSKKEIIVFDVATENYLQQLLPLPVIKWRGQACQHLDVLSERLFLSCSFWNGSDKEGRDFNFFELWVMNDYGAKDYTWAKMFRIETTSYYVLRPVAFVKHKRRVLLQGENEIVWFDEKSQTKKSIAIHGISDSNNSSQACVGSLFRLHDGCGRRRVARRTRNLTNLAAAAHTKRLAFCVRDFYDEYYASHDKCHDSTSPNWYYPPAKRIKVCGTSKSDPGGDGSPALPPYICRQIFLCSQAKSVIRFRAVCKAWRAVIDDPCFVKAHTNKQPVSNVLLRNSTGPPFHPLHSFDLDGLDFKKALQKLPATPYEFTGTSRSFPCLPVHGCNGLMLITDYDDDDDDDDEKLHLWNPLTGEHLELPQVPEYDSTTTRVVAHAIGLGYDQATDDYKVVATLRERGDCYVCGTHVYSLRADSWKRIGDRPCCWEQSQGPGVFLNGALHWFSSSSSGEYNKIIALDLTTESYRQLKGPLLGRRRTDLADDKRCLGVLGDCLIVTDFGESEKDRYNYDIWVMKDYGSEDSWTKLFSIADDNEKYKFCRRPKHLRPLTYMQNKTQILLQDESWFYLFDVESDSVKKVICIHGLTQHLSSQIFPGSIFRLHDFCGVSGKRRIRKRTESNMIMKRPPTDMELYFCVRDGDIYYYDFGYDSSDDSDSDSDSDFNSHGGCYTVDSNWYCSSSENVHQD